jgi:hypothetical protein
MSPVGRRYTGGRPRNALANALIKNSTMNTKKRILATPAKLAAIPPNPNNAATNDNISNRIASRNMTKLLSQELAWLRRRINLPATPGLCSLRSH